MRLMGSGWATSIPDRLKLFICLCYHHPFNVFCPECSTMYLSYFILLFILYIVKAFEVDKVSEIMRE